MRCSNCGEVLSPASRSCSRCGTAVSREFNYKNMEKELLHTVWEEEAIPGISGGTALYRQSVPKMQYQSGMKEMNHMYETEENEDMEEVKKQPFKLAVALLTGAAVFAGAAFYLRTLPDTYHYGKTETEYNHCLTLMAEGDYEGAAASIDLLLEQESDSLAYLALKNTICENSGDTKKQVKVLKKIIKADKDNYQAYERLLQIYVKNKNQDAIVKLSEGAPNSAIAAMLDEYLIETPYLELTPGLYDSSQTLAISSEKGTSIYYTLDGSPPQENGVLYTAPFALQQDRFYSVRAVCKNENGAYGEETSGDYQIGIDADPNISVTQIGEPAVYPDSGTYTDQQRITIDVPIGYQAYYSWMSGAELTPQNGTLYTGGITMPEGNSQLSVIVADADGNCSPVKQVSYTYQPQ